jgi:hypothetical protein
VTRVECGLLLKFWFWMPFFGVLGMKLHSAIEAGAEKPDPGFPETRGRMSRLKGGEPGARELVRGRRKIA